MADSNAGLTLDGLAQILRDHMDGTAARFADVGARIRRILDAMEHRGGDGSPAQQ